MELGHSEFISESPNTVEAGNTASDLLPYQNAK